MTGESPAIVPATVVAGIESREGGGTIEVVTVQPVAMAGHRSRSTTTSAPRMSHGERQKFRAASVMPSRANIVTMLPQSVHRMAGLRRALVRAGVSPTRNGRRFGATFADSGVFPLTFRFPACI